MTADFDLAMDALTRQMIELQVMDTIRDSRDSRMPLVTTSQRFDVLATKMAKCSRMACGQRQREMIAFFGCPPMVVAKVWEMMHEHETITAKAKDKHLLWALHHLREHPSLRVMCSTMRMEEDKTKPDDKTICKWVWIILEAIADLQDEVIQWEKRKKNDDRGSSCLIGVDCKDCKFQQILIPHPRKPGKKIIGKSPFSQKLNAPGLRHEIGLALLSNDTVWLRGPCLPGDWSDVTILRQELKWKLAEAGERAEADGGCMGEAPDCISCLKNLEVAASELRLQFNKRAQGRIEAINNHITHWRCFDNGKFLAKGTASEKMEKHRIVFTACLVAKQLGMDLGVGELCKMGDECN